MPAFLKLGSIFILVIFILRFRQPLSVALLFASLAAGLLFGIPKGGLIAAFKTGLLGARTWHLLAAILTISTLGSLLRRKGKLTDMARGAEGILKSRKLALGAVPALIGMMPMPGGALLSAPMVEELDVRKELSAEQKASINYLFRHIMEFAFPLYPGMLLLATLLGVPVFKVVYALLPLFLALLLGCGHYLARHVQLSDSRPEASSGKKNWAALFSGIWPAALVVLLSLGGHLDILAALAGVLLLAVLHLRAGWREIVHSLREGIGPETVFSIISIMVFQQVLAAAGGLQELPELFAKAGLASWAPVFFLPFIIGLLTGMTTACLGLTFPLLAGFLVSPSGTVHFGAAMLAYTAGFLGIMGSPTHLCLVLTYDYFKPQKLALYRHMFFPLFLVGGTALALFAAGYPWGLIR